MELTGTERIQAPREKVWRALNDPDVLKSCIPGCESIEMLSPTEMKARVGLRLGPIKTNFEGKVTLSNIDPPNGYTISGEGSGGPAGSAKGSAQVTLTEEAGATLLSYSVTSQVSGKIAQLGARLIEGTAHKLAGDFFGKFNETVSAPAAGAAQAAALEPAAPTITQAPVGWSQWRWFIAGAIVIAALLIWLAVR